MGISRDDLGAFIPNYMEQGIWSNDPFNKLMWKVLGIFYRNWQKLEYVQTKNSPYLLVGSREVILGFSQTLCGGSSCEGKDSTQ
eukprot:8877549-Ditylum_brightwellii.AAC.1